MTPEQAVTEATRAELRPVYLVHGEERYLSSLVMAELRKAAVGGGAPGLNEDQFDAASSGADVVLAAARTLPMMAKRRLVVVRSIEKWEPRGEAKPETKTDAKGRVTSLDRVAEYAANPSPTTTLVLVSGKLDARRRLVVLAKKDGFIVECDTPPRNALPTWLSRRAKTRGKTLAPGVGDLLAEIAGPELARLDDAIERLSLFVGDEAEIGEDAVAEALVGVKPSSVWELVGAVGRRDLGGALASLARIYDPKDRGLPLLGTLAWSMRQLVKFHGATSRGLSPPDAAKFAGAPPFKATELASQVKQFSGRDLERWLLILAEMDLSLKGGSKRPPLAVLEASLMTLCSGKRGGRSQRGGRSEARTSAR